jgi:hypothetical protein
MKGYASRPGNVPPKLSCWLRHHPVANIVAAIVFLESLVYCLNTRNATAFVICITSVAATSFFWYRIVLFLRRGNVLPGKVIAIQPTTLAFLAEPAKSPRPGTWERPALWVERGPLPTAVGATPEVGSPIVAIAGYSGPVSEPYWRSFCPLPVDWVANDAEVSRRLLATINGDEWEILEHAVAQLPERPDQKMYPVQLR